LSAIRRTICLWALLLSCCAGPLLYLCGAQCSAGQRRITVADGIAMAEFDPPVPALFPEPDAPGLLSPDRSRSAVILSRGDLRNNTVRYTLLVFSMRTVWSAERPLASLSMTSSSNDSAIADLHWLSDNRTLLFLGENPHSLAQIYSFDSSAQKLTRLTNHPTSIVRFDASADGRVLVFEADPVRADFLHTEDTARHGFRVEGEELSTLLLSGYRGAPSESFESRDIFVMMGNRTPRKIALKDGVWPFLSIFASPNGDYALLETMAARIPEDWKLYQEPVVRQRANTPKPPGAYSWVQTYLLLDTATGRVSSLLSAPKDWPQNGVFWLDGGKSLIVSHSYLPVDGVSAQEREERENHTSVVEVFLPSRKMTIIDGDSLTATAWNPTTGVLIVSGSSGVRHMYRRSGSAWHAIDEARAMDRAPRPSLEVVEDLNLPPTLWLSDSTGAHKLMLLDPNPQFRRLCFGPEQSIEWKASDSRMIRGGLYLPPDYTPGRRYPLVIQTHSFEPHRFRIDGPWHTGYAAQALAAKEIVVLQMNERTAAGTPEEGPQAMSSFESAIDYLSRQGIIDPSRVGILGFSRSVYRVSYTLTHSRYRFRAATLEDGVDGSYFQAVITADYEGPDAAALNGASPWGKGLTEWIEHSPLFNVDRISCPIRIQTNGMSSLLSMWPWYSLLMERVMPVELILLPDASHEIVKPWERLVSQEGNVDWFAFWLTGQEDLSPDKVAQYKRWRRFQSDLASRPSADNSALH
jgi:dipeptidyl aminopeptidase/acylaminoacyl peptidase